MAVALLAAAAIVRHYRKLSASSLLGREYFMVPEGMIPAHNVPQLFTFPGGMPGNGLSGRATNEEDVSDPYGGGDKRGPYGYVNDPYDGDWALNPLGGKQVKMQALPMLQSAAQAAPADNIWNSDVMGTDSIFMHTMSSKDANQNLMSKRGLPAPSEFVGPGGPGSDSTWVGTDQVFFGSNGGGYGWARRADAKPLPGQALAAAAGPKPAPRAQKSLFQSLFRSDDAHLAEYGLEGPNQLNDDVLPSAVGTGGPVIGVDGLPSNVDHAWAKHDEEFSFKCSDDIYGCAGGLTVDPVYAHD